MTSSNRVHENYLSEFIFYCQSIANEMECKISKFVDAQKIKSVNQILNVLFMVSYNLMTYSLTPYILPLSQFTTKQFKSPTI